MQRVTVSLDNDLAARFDAIVRDRSYASRSEAVRDLVRQLVDGTRLEAEEPGDCVACLSYTYRYRTRDLAQRLFDFQHAHHDLVVSAMHMALDHDATLETVLLRGRTAAVRALADRIIAERGVQFGALNVIGVESNDDHAEPAPHRHHGHNHLSPFPG